MLKLDRILITLLFAGYVGKLLILGANLPDAPIMAILASVYFLFFYKLQESEVELLKKELVEQKQILEENKKTIDDVKTAMASMKIANGFRQAK